VSAVLDLTRELLRAETINPPGAESRATDIVGGRLEAAGLEARRHPLAPGRDSLVARWEGSGTSPSLCLTAHLDTVPLGETEWTREPLAGELDGDRLYGRGASDMKGGLAAIVMAAERVAALGRGESGLELVLCAGEETGCEGARRLARSGVLGEAGAVLVAEPTSNYPCVAHKGVVWLEATTKGRSAHGSMPHLGDNAVYKLARAVVALEGFRFDGPEHPLLGSPTLSVGTAAGGANVNSVPDRAGAGIDGEPCRVWKAWKWRNASASCSAQTCV
jgi:succinyl-diaminopimelate desuccinylase